MDVNGIPGQRIVLQSTTDFRTWQPLANKLAGGESVELHPRLGGERPAILPGGDTIALHAFVDGSGISAAYK